MYQLGRYMASDVHEIHYRTAMRGIRSQHTYLQEIGLTQLLRD